MLKLRTELPSGPTVHLKGQIDLLLENEEGQAVVIDYKLVRKSSAGLEPYQFQLDCYSLAATHLVQQGVPIKTGIVFLLDPDPSPVMRSPVTAEEIRDLESKINRAARELVFRHTQGNWPVMPQSHCERIRCGYQYHCHPAGHSV